MEKVTLNIDLGTSDLFMRTFESDGTYLCWVCGQEIPKAEYCLAMVSKGPIDITLHNSCSMRLSALFEIFAIEVEEQSARFQDADLPIDFPGSPPMLDLGPRIEKVGDLELYQLFELDKMEVYIESFPTENSVILRSITKGGTWSTSKQTLGLFKRNAKRVNRMYDVVNMGEGCTPLPIKS